MNKTLKSVLIFIGGAVTGGVITGVVVHSVTKKKCDAEIDSVIKAFDEQRNKEQIVVEASAPDVQEEPAKEVSETTREEYNKLVNAYHEAKDEPYQITRDEYGESENDIFLLNYYSDGVMMFEKEEEPLSLDEVHDLIGPDNIALLGDIPDNSLYIRNPQRHADYEIYNKDVPFYKIKGDST